MAPPRGHSFLLVFFVLFFLLQRLRGRGWCLPVLGVARCLAEASGWGVWPWSSSASMRGLWIVPTAILEARLGVGGGAWRSAWAARAWKVRGNGGICVRWARWARRCGARERAACVVGEGSGAAHGAGPGVTASSRAASGVRVPFLARSFVAALHRRDTRACMHYVCTRRASEGNRSGARARVVARVCAFSLESGCVRACVYVGASSGIRIDIMFRAASDADADANTDADTACRPRGQYLRASLDNAGAARTAAVAVATRGRLDGATDAAGVHPDSAAARARNCPSTSPALTESVSQPATHSRADSPRPRCTAPPPSCACQCAPTPEPAHAAEATALPDAGCNLAHARSGAPCALCARTCNLRWRPRLRARRSFERACARPRAALCFRRCVPVAGPPSPAYRAASGASGRCTAGSSPLLASIRKRVTPVLKAISRTALRGEAAGSGRPSDAAAGERRQPAQGGGRRIHPKPQGTRRHHRFVARERGPIAGHADVVIGTIGAPSRHPTRDSSAVPAFGKARLCETGAGSTTISSPLLNYV